MAVTSGRREFLGASLASLAALTVPGGVWAADSAKPEKDAAPKPEPTPSPTDSLFLTWQRDPTSTMTVQWVGDDRGPVKIEYSIFSDQEDADWKSARTSLKEFPGTDQKVHRCELTDLRPGTEYQFRVDGEKKIRRFRTMPATATNTIQFVSGGDAGTGSHAIETNILAAKQEPYFAFIGGDLAYDNGASPRTFLRFLRNYNAHMIDPQGRMIPLIACIGNHEVKGGYNGKRADAGSYLSVFDGFYPEKTYGVLDIGDYMSLVLLDTGHIAPIKGEQTDWLERTLAERQDRQHLIVANHVPAYPSHRAWAHDTNAGTGADNRKYWSPLFEKYKVDVVLEHHDHTFKRTHPMLDGHINKNGLIYLGDGSWGKLRPLKDPEQRPYLAAYASSYHCTVHRFEGDQRFHVALADTGRVADVCTTFSKRPSKRG
jgi:hypothetical protein